MHAVRKIFPAEDAADLLRQFRDGSGTSFKV